MVRKRMNLDRLEKIDSKKMFKVYDMWPDLAKKNWSRWSYRNIDVDDTNTTVAIKLQKHKTSLYLLVQDETADIVVYTSEFATLFWPFFLLSLIHI